MRYLILCILLLCSCASTTPKSKSVFGSRADAERDRPADAQALLAAAVAPGDTLTARDVLLADLARQTQYARNAVGTLGVAAAVAGAWGWSNANG